MKAYRRLAEAAAATLPLLAPAMWNGFPFLQYDSGGYLARWFEGYLVPSRSTVYGLFAVAGWPLDFWPEMLVQAAVAVWITLRLLAATVAVALLANAVVCGALSNPHSRYGARLAWIATFAVALVPMRYAVTRPWKTATAEA